MTHLIGWTLFVGLLLATAPFVAQVEAQPCYTYRVIDITNPSGETQQTALRAINHAGVIAGQYTDPDTMGHNPFPEIPEQGFQLVRQGKTKLLVTRMPPINIPPVTELHTLVQAINTHRDVAGNAHVGEDSPAPPGVGSHFGYVRRHLKVPTIRYIAFPGADETHVYGMNDKRDLVGSFSMHWTEESGNSRHGFWLYRGTYIQIDAPFPGVISTWLSAINNDQRIVGWYTDTEGQVHGLDIIGGVYATLDVPGATRTYLRGLNDHGDIVGTYWTGHPDTGMTITGFVYQDGAFFDLDFAVNDDYFEPSGINNRGEIVGRTGEGGHHPQFGVIATPAKCANTVAQR